MDLETRHLAAFVGKVTLRVRDILSRAQVQRFEIRRGEPKIETYPHWMALTEPLDFTSSALVEEELNKAFWFDPRHHHGEARRTGDTEVRDRNQAVYLAWAGTEFPGGSTGVHPK
ncbi:MAG TPA: hypothetical protein VL404_00040 [Candidatus Eisenbacteria bacterium]|nr:hypothetical protein [Candidatus Eisenbacteria bacterium]